MAQDSDTSATNIAVHTKSSESRKNNESQSLLKRKPFLVVHAQHDEVFQRLPDILEGYRVGHSFVDALCSWFVLHIDTVNIWTHFIGLLYLMYVGFEVHQVLSADNAPKSEYIAFSLAVTGSMWTMVGSIIYHTFRFVSPRVEKLCWKIDVSGIAGTILGNFTIALYEGFYCNTITMSIYVGILLFNISVVAFIAAKPNHSLVSLYIAMTVTCVLGLAPSIHWALTTKFGVPILTWFMPGAFLSYAIGFTLYIVRWPERSFPGKFDYVGSSHQIWHCFVVSGAVFWLQGMLEYHKERIFVGAVCNSDGN